MRVKTMLLAGFFVFALVASSFAAVNIENRTGTIKVSMPDGTVLTIAANQPLPAIPDGAVITLVSGTASITTTGASMVSVAIGGSTVQINSGSSVNLGLNSSGTANIATTSGQVVVSNGGTKATLDTGDSVNVSVNSATSTGSFQVVSGSIDVQTPNGQSSTLDSNSPAFEFKAEAYTPPAITDVPEVKTEVKTEETTKDISPVK
jgi:hypothetical protein